MTFIWFCVKLNFNKTECLANSEKALYREASIPLITPTYTTQDYILGIQITCFLSSPIVKSNGILISADGIAFYCH